MWVASVRGMASRRTSFEAMVLGMCGDQESKCRANLTPPAKSLMRHSSGIMPGALIASPWTSFAWWRQKLPGRTDQPTGGFHI